MKPKLLLRIAAGLVLFFLMGHNIGHFTWRQTDDAAKQEVINLMDGRHFEWNGTVRSLGQNYDGYSFLLSSSLVMLAWLLFVLANGTTSGHSKLVRKACWPIALGLALYAFFSFTFFFAVPGITCLLASAAVAWAGLRLKP